MDLIKDWVIWLADLLQYESQKNNTWILNCRKWFQYAVKLIKSLCLADILLHAYLQSSWKQSLISLPSVICLNDLGSTLNDLHLKLNVVHTTKRNAYIPHGFCNLLRCFSKHHLYSAHHTATQQQKLVLLVVVKNGASLVKSVKLNRL